MKSLIAILRVAVISVAALAAFQAENPAKAHVVAPSTPRIRPLLPPPPVARPDIADWTGPTRQATIWR